MMIIVITLITVVLLLLLIVIFILMMFIFTYDIITVFINFLVWILFVSSYFLLYLVWKSPYWLCNTYVFSELVLPVLFSYYPINRNASGTFAAMIQEFCVISTRSIETEIGKVHISSSGFQITLLIMHILALWPWRNILKPVSLNMHAMNMKRHRRQFYRLSDATTLK